MEPAKKKLSQGQLQQNSVVIRRMNDTKKCQEIKGYRSLYKWSFLTVNRRNYKTKLEEG